MKPSEKLFARIRTELGEVIPDDAYMIITHCGHWQRSSGAWSSVIASKSNIHFEIGLYVPIRQLLKCPKLIIYRSLSCSRTVDCGCKSNCVGVAPQTLLKRCKTTHNISMVGAKPPQIGEAPTSPC